MTRLVQPLKIHGGKHYLAKRIIELMPKHIHYVEPFFGGGSVLLQKPAELIEGYSEVVNDINGDLINFWRAIADQHIFPVFQKAVSCCPFSSEEWTRMKVLLDEEWESIQIPQVKRAAAFFIHARQSMAGRGDCFTPLTRTRTRRGMNEQVSSWLTAIEGLPEIHERLKRVVILNDDACKVIKQQDGENTFFYCDPPYLQSTRSSTGEYGEHEMSDDDHEELLHCLSQIKGKFILSGYLSELYVMWGNNHGWRRVDIEIDNKASSKKKKEKKTECLWLNHKEPSE